MKVFCGKCGKECPEGVRFCPYCGQPLPKLVEELGAPQEPAVEVEPAAQAEVQAEPVQQVAVQAVTGATKATAYLRKWQCQIRSGLLLAFSLTVMLVTLFSGVKHTVGVGPVQIEVKQTMFQAADAAFGVGMNRTQAQEYVTKWQEESKKILYGSIIGGAEGVASKLSKMNFLKAQLAESVLAGGKAEVVARASTALIIPNLLLWLATVIFSAVFATRSTVCLIRGKQIGHTGYYQSVLALLFVVLLCFACVPRVGAGASLYVALSMLLVGAGLTTVFEHLTGECKLNVPGLLKTGALFVSCIAAVFCLVNGGVKADMDTMVEGNFGTAVWFCLLVFAVSFAVSVCLTLFGRLLRAEYRFDKMNGRLITAFVFSVLLVVMGYILPLIFTYSASVSAALYVAAVLLLLVIVLRVAVKMPQARETTPE